jgi:hypothetical protein
VIFATPAIVSRCFAIYVFKYCILLRWQSLLFWFAYMVAMTLADVEVRHARNRATSNKHGLTKFNNFCATYTNKEAACLTKASKKQCLLMAAGSSERASDPARIGSGSRVTNSFIVSMFARSRYHKFKQSSDSNSLSNTCSKPGAVCDKGLLGPKSTGKDAFRIDFWAAQKMLGIKLNPCEESTWLEIAQAWDELSDERRALYDLQVNIAKAKARTSEAMAVSSEGGSGDADSNSAALAPIPLAPPMPRVNGSIRAVPFMANLVSDGPGLANSSATLTDFCTTLQNAVASAANQVHDPRPTPISESDVAESLTAARNNGLDLKKSCALFARGAQNIAGPRNESDVFPDTVRYRSHCQGMCRFSTAFAQVQLHVALLEALDLCVVRHGGTMPTIDADVMLAFDVSWPFGRAFVFALVTSPSSQSGIHQAGQVYVDLTCIAGDPLESLVANLANSMIQSFQYVTGVS